MYNNIKYILIQYIIRRIIEILLVLESGNVKRKCENVKEFTKYGKSAEIFGEGYKKICKKIENKNDD